MALTSGGEMTSSDVAWGNVRCYPEEMKQAERKAGTARLNKVGRQAESSGTVSSFLFLI